MQNITQDLPISNSSPDSSQNTTNDSSSIKSSNTSLHSLQSSKHTPNSKISHQHSMKHPQNKPYFLQDDKKENERFNEFATKNDTTKKINFTILDLKHNPSNEFEQGLCQSLEDNRQTIINSSNNAQMIHASINHEQQLSPGQLFSNTDVQNNINQIFSLTERSFQAPTEILTIKKYNQHLEGFKASPQLSDSIKHNLTFLFQACISGIEQSYNNPQQLMQDNINQGFKPNMKEIPAISSTAAKPLTSHIILNSLAPTLTQESPLHSTITPIDARLIAPKDYGLEITRLDGNHNWCWMRAGWSIVLENTFPELIKNTIIDTLGEQWSDIADEIKNYAEKDVQRSGHAIQGKIKNTAFEALLFKVYFAMFAKLSPDKLHSDNTNDHGFKPLLKQNETRDETHALGICQLFNQPAARLQATSQGNQGGNNLEQGSAIELSCSETDHKNLYNAFSNTISNSNNYTNIVEYQNSLLNILNQYKVPLMKYASSGVGHFERIRAKTAS